MYIYMSVPDSSEQCPVTFFLQRLDRLVRQRGAGALEAVVAGVEVDEGEAQAQRGGQRFEDASAGLDI